MIKVLAPAARIAGNSLLLAEPQEIVQRSIVAVPIPPSKLSLLSISAGNWDVASALFQENVESCIRNVLLSKLLVHALAHIPPALTAEISLLSNVQLRSCVVHAVVRLQCSK
jgi:hypothetical protein